MPSNTLLPKTLFFILFSLIPSLAPSAAPTFWGRVSSGDQGGKREVTLFWKVTTWRPLIVWQSGCAVNLTLACSCLLLSFVLSSPCLTSWLTDKSATTTSPVEGPSRGRSSTAAETYTQESRSARCGSLSIDAPAIWRPPTPQGPHLKPKCGSTMPMRKVRNT